MSRRSYTILVRSNGALRRLARVAMAAAVWVLTATGAFGYGGCLGSYSGTSFDFDNETGDYTLLTSATCQALSGGEDCTPSWPNGGIGVFLNLEITGPVSSLTALPLASCLACSEPPPAACGGSLECQPEGTYTFEVTSEHPYKLVSRPGFVRCVRFGPQHVGAYSKYSPTCCGSKMACLADSGPAANL